MRKFWYIVFIIFGSLILLYGIYTMICDDEMMFIGSCIIIFSSFSAILVGAGIIGLKNKPSELQQFIKDVEAGKYEIKKKEEEKDKWK